MSVFKRNGAPTYSYDFQCRGRRFSGATPCTTKREADAYEKRIRDEVRKSAADPNQPMSFGEACTLFYEQKGQHHAVPETTERNLGWLQANIGSKTPIAAITDATVARLVALKRTETRPMRKGGKTVQVPIAAGTVNRSMTELLRNIITRAATVWEQKVSRIDWSGHRLKEAQERVREASDDEVAIVLAAIPADYRPAVRFALLTGCRRAEIVGLRWTDVNFFSRDFRVTGKGDRSRTIPMTAEVRELLWSLKDQHASAVFTFQATRTRDGRVRGERYPISAEGLATIWNRHARGKVADFRFHDTRHTAATRLVRATGNLKMAQHLLGHTSVTTTTRYAHVTHDDLRDGLEAVSRARTTTENHTSDTQKSAK